MKLFQYAIFFNPKKDFKGPKPQIIKGKSGESIVSVLAEDIEKAKLLAARDIPEEWVESIDQLEIAVRPF
jgi:hypothetical protein